METKAKTVGEFIDFCDKSRECMEGRKINIDLLEKYYAVANVVRLLFTDAIIEVEKPNRRINTTNIVIHSAYFDCEKEAKELFIKVLQNVDGISISSTDQFKNDESNKNVLIILTIENIWEE